MDVVRGRIADQQDPKNDKQEKRMWREVWRKCIQEKGSVVEEDSIQEKGAHWNQTRPDQKRWGLGVVVLLILS